MRFHPTGGGPKTTKMEWEAFILGLVSTGLFGLLVVSVLVAWRLFAWKSAGTTTQLESQVAQSWLPAFIAVGQICRAYRPP